MPEVTIHIGGRGFDVSCQDGEETVLHSAAKLLDDEAQGLLDQIGQMPESRMLLLAGLMLADKVVAQEDRVKLTDAKLVEAEAELKRVRNMSQPEPERIDVADVPSSVTNMLAEVAARAEALATVIEEKSA